MKKIALLTLHRVFNYGSVLQTLATQKLIEKTGNKCEVVDYITPQRTKAALRREYKITGLRTFIYYFFRAISIEIKWRGFNAFLKKNVNLSKKRYIDIIDLRQNPPQADIYMTGSDQVWNSVYNKGIDEGFFLQFGDKNIKRVAFASSFGLEKLEEAEQDKIKQYLADYRHISVREESAAEIVNSLIGKRPEVVLDPTLQIRAEEWFELEADKLMKDKYVLLMLLYNEDNGATDIARKIADDAGWKLVKISWDLFKDGRVDKLFTHRSPEDFISLVHNAEYVVTNSFHGTAFCINFNKQFTVVRRNQMQTRIDNILRMTGLENRLVSNLETFDINSAKERIDYANINAVLEKERQRSIGLLEEAING